MYRVLDLLILGPKINTETKTGAILAYVPISFCLGYAGWSPEQLEDEIDADAWHVVAGKFELGVRLRSGIAIGPAHQAVGGPDCGRSYTEARRVMEF